jgi:hypothetical protein
MIETVFTTTGECILAMEIGKNKSVARLASVMRGKK